MKNLAARFRAGHALLFVIPGGTGGFPTANLELYRDNRAFRDSIERTGSVIEGMLGWTAAAAFRGEQGTAATREVERRNELVHHGMARIALIDQWREDGIVPDGAIGVSLGEVIAPYAIGAISRSDCARLIAVVAQSVTEPPAAYRIYVVEADAEQARRLCRTAPVSIDFLGTSSPTLALALCRESDSEAARSWFGDRVVKEAPSGWPYHTPNMYWNRAWSRAQLGRGVPLGPTEHLIYSPALGALLPRGTRYDAQCVRWMMTGPSHFAEAVSAALDDGVDTFVQVAPRPVHILADVMKIAEAEGRRVRQVHAFDAKARASLRGLRRRGITPIPSAPPAVACGGSVVEIDALETGRLAERLLQPLVGGSPFDVVSALADPIADSVPVDRDSLRRILAESVLEMLRDGTVRRRVIEDPDCLRSLAIGNPAAIAALRALLRLVPDFTAFQPVDTVYPAHPGVVQLMIAR